MLLNHSQFTRLVKTFAPGNPIKVGPVPDIERQRSGPGWVSEMNQLANRVVRVHGIVNLESPVLADGRVMYDLFFRVEDSRGYKFDLSMDWIKDQALDEILDNPNPIAVKKVSEQNSKSNLGLGLTAGGAMAALLGLTALKNRQKKVAENSIQEKVQEKVYERCEVEV